MFISNEQMRFTKNNYFQKVNTICSKFCIYKAGGVLRMTVINDVFSHYFPNNTIINVKEIAGGTVNKTYVVETEDKKRVVIQKINKFVFGDNIAFVERNYKQFKQTYDRCIEKYFNIPIWEEKDSGNLFCRSTDGEYWRVYSFLPGEGLDSTADKNRIIIFGGTVAAMHTVLKGYKGNPECAISHFHDLKYYLNIFLNLKDVNADRNIEIEEIIKSELNFILNNCFFQKNAVIHGDTKIKNIIFNKKTNEISFIDLDTFYYASKLIDIADSIRSISNTAGDVPENEDNVDFDREVCVEFLRAYLQFEPGILSEEEKKRLPNAIIRMPFELGVRFYYDYLNGNQYFPVEYQNQNLKRAKCQFKLFQRMLEKNVFDIEDEIDNR